MNIRAIIFDFDGTMCNTNQLILDSWQHTFRTFWGREEDPRKIYKTYGEPLRMTMKKIFQHEWEKAIQIYRKWQLAQPDDRWELFPGIYELVVKLKEKGYLVGIVTSRTGDTCRKGLAACGLDGMIDALVTCEDTQVHKPEAEPALIGLAKLGVEADEALFIGDTRFDIGCAHNAGIKAVLVTWSVSMEPGEHEGLFAEDYVIEKPDDLLDLLAE